MKDEKDASAKALRKRDADTLHQYADDQTNTPSAGRQAPFQPNGHPPAGATLDFWVVIDLLIRQWHWLLLGSLACAAVFFVLGLYVVGPKYTASGSLLRYELPGTELLKTTAPISPETFAGLMRSPELLRRVGEKYVPPLPPEKLNKLIKIEPEPDSDIITVMLAARDPNVAADLLNRYMRETEAYTKELQAQQAGKMANDYLKKQLQQMEGDVAALEQRFRTLPVSPLLTNKLAQIGTNVNAISANLAASPQGSLLLSEQMKRLTAALGELTELTSKYTDFHPLVKAKQSEIQSLQQQMNAAATNASPGSLAMLRMGTGDSAFNPDIEIIHTKLRSLEEGRLQLANRQYEAQLYATDPPGMARILTSADAKGTKSNFRWLKIVLVTVFGGLVGVGVSVALVMLVEFADNRLKTTDDLQRVTKLPVFATLGNLHEMAPAARSQWAFRTWTMLQGRLSPTPNHGLICGVTSSSPGEGRSTWISLLAEAASLTGFRVLTIATRPSPTHVESAIEDPDQPLPEDPEMNTSGFYSTALTTNVLSSPTQVTDQLTGPNAQPVVHIPLPGWVWNLERRKQWRDALSHWRQVENLVILVELPPADIPEAVLLGSNLPNMVWLADSGKARAAETRTQLETLRDARCNLVGTVLNHEPSPPLKKRFPRWIGCFLCMTALGLCTARAQDTNTPQFAEIPAATPAAADGADAQPAGSFSIVHPSQRAEWQKRLTLGPGDILSFGLYGDPDLARTEVAIAPDGRVNYLEATNVLATGLTIDELRAKLDDALGLYRRAPRTMVTPVAFRSKKYYMLGKVMGKGVYTLDRPLTVLEALARAKGFESGLVDRNIVDLVDYSRSFLVRGGKRYPLNFESLFQGGNLSQNIAIEPGDYIYFASGMVNEVYVVGEIRLPGTVSYKPSLTIIEAITARGGYTERAFKARVMVVRGSLNNPEKIVVDTHAILDAKALDFKLKPKDIIYVNSRPFILVEELADLAITAFIQSAVTEATGVHVVTPINTIQ